MRVIFFRPAPHPAAMTTGFSRRRFLEAAGASLAVGAGCTGSSQPVTDTDGPGTAPPVTTTPPTGTAPPEPTATTPPEPTVPEAVGLETIVDGLDAPVDVAFAPDADRRYVAEQDGRVLVHGAEGLREEPLLDLTDAVDLGRETGLLGIALHPGFADNRRLFVRYSAPEREGTPSDYSHTFVLAEFPVSADGQRADRDAERTVLEIPEPQGNHNSGAVAFGPDGLLYVGVGDGGSSGDRGDGHVDDWYDAVDGGNGQDVEANLLGSVLRLDVDDVPDGRAYAVPDDNPLVGSPGLDEQYAWGFRNPWRLSFDGADLYVGDVGQRSYEEVDLVERGGNYGWNVREGTHCYDADECPSATPSEVRGGEPLIDPIIEYPRSDEPVSGISVIGGHVYRGDALPGLRGAYLFGDLEVEGRLFVATRPEGGELWPTAAVGLAGDADERLERLRSFGQDAAGEVYALGTGDGDGGLYRVVPAE